MLEWFGRPAASEPETDALAVTASGKDGPGGGA
jgi:hypothetical protein